VRAFFSDVWLVAAIGEQVKNKLCDRKFQASKQATK
jgi:hypothetical protein